MHINKYESCVDLKLYRFQNLIRNLDGQQINHQIKKKLSDMICLAIKYYLVKKKSIYKFKFQKKIQKWSIYLMNQPCRKSPRLRERLQQPSRKISKKLRHPLAEGGDLLIQLKLSTIGRMILVIQQFSKSLSRKTSCSVIIPLL